MTWIGAGLPRTGAPSPLLGLEAPGTELPHPNEAARVGERLRETLRRG